MESRSLVLALLLSPMALTADPDFTGTWRLSEQRSERRALPHTPASTLKIQQSGLTVRWEASGTPDSCSFTLDGKESRCKTASGTRSTITKWEGAALLLNAIVTQPSGQYTEMDRWKISRDGKVLTIRRHIVSLRGGLESTLVYERAADLP